MKIKSNQIYYTVESLCWMNNSNYICTLEFLSRELAVEKYKELRKSYQSYDELRKANTMFRLAKVQNKQSITLACCGYGVMDNLNFADEESII